jgi:hypothetical protein
LASIRNIAPIQTVIVEPSLHLPMILQHKMLVLVRGFCLFLVCLAASLFVQPLQVCAQVDSSTVRDADRNLNSFTSMQNEMMVTMKKQKVRLGRLREKLINNRSELNEIINLLKYPKNVPIYRDTAYKLVKAIRGVTDESDKELKDLFFQWYGYNRELMATFTRYGELKVLNRMDDNLRQFLLQHRDNMTEFGKTQEMIQDLYNDCNYLLNSKLN